jgi:TOMM system kinase/cyclase fusion protein
LDSIPPGTVFQERYELVAKVGEGGFASVYRARDRVTGQDVAVKVLRVRLSDADTHVLRFQRELRLGARLHHPHIVRLIDSGQVEQHPYTVFEFIPGHTLADVLGAESALSPAEAAHLMMQVLDALGCAHNQGVVHRDLKPQNLMLSATGVRRNAHVLDFGLGTLTENARLDVTRITRTREVLGTPAYAAPEQLRGEPVSARSDLYSWALIFLECLTGQRVVVGPTLQSLLFKQLGPDAVDLPDWLEGHRLGRLLRRALVKDVEARDVTARGLLRELEACVQDGWPLSPARPEPAVPPGQALTLTEAQSAEGEHRQLTAVCCGFELFATGEREPDVEDLDRLLREQHEACLAVARRHDAHVGGVLGSQLLLVFGYPKAREDDARRAARAALEIRAQAERSAEALARAHGLRLEVRVGLHTGLVISHERRPRLAGLSVLAGTTPHLAARLEGLARPGTILVSEATQRLLREHFLLEPAGAHALGASARPVEVFQLRDAPRAPGPRRSTAEPDAGRLYGRARELELLGQRWRQARGGEGQVILIGGEPGIGKSRLARELGRLAAEAPHTFLECRCAPESRHSALRPVVELLEGLLGLERDWTAERTVRGLEELLGHYGFSLPESVPLFAALLNVPAGEKYPPPDVSPQRAKALTLEALLSLLCEMAERQPVLLLVEDLHWADRSTQELLTKLVEDAPGLRLCAVFTARPEFSAPWSSAQVLQVQLGRLERERVEEMVRGLTREAPLPREVLEQVVSRTDGVPLFVEELTRMVVEALVPVSGSAGAGDTPTRSRPAAPLAIPTTLRDSLMARLDRLGTAKETAQLASALGREFSLEVLKAISPREEAALRRDLDALVEADLVYRRRSRHTLTYVFKHALVRDTAYHSLLKPARRQVHARIAQALEQRFPELVETRPDLLAHHHAAAEQKLQALDYARRAGLGALMRSANHEALAHATEALAWLEALEAPRERAQVELALNGIITPALMSTRGWADEQIRAQVERSRQLIDVLGDGPHTAPTLWALVTYHHTRGERAAARAVAERLVAMAEQAGDTDALVAALPALGQCLCTEGRFAQARGVLERVTALYDAARHRALTFQYGLDPRAWADMTLALNLWLQGFPEQSLERARAALDTALELKHASSTALAYLYLVMVRQMRGEVAEVVAVADLALQLTERVGLPSHEMYLRLIRAGALHDVEELRRQLATMEALGLDLARSYYESMLAEAEAGLGQSEAALARVEALLERARETGERFYLPELLRLKGTFLARGRADGEAAEACFRQAMGAARELGGGTLELRAAVSLCEWWRERGLRAEARDMLAPVLARFTEGFDAPDLVRARALLGELNS